MQGGVQGGGGAGAQGASGAAGPAGASAAAQAGGPAAGGSAAPAGEGVLALPQDVAAGLAQRLAAALGEDSGGRCDLRGLCNVLESIKERLLPHAQRYSKALDALQVRPLPPALPPCCLDLSHLSRCHSPAPGSVQLSRCHACLQTLFEQASKAPSGGGGGVFQEMQRVLNVLRVTTSHLSMDVVARRLVTACECLQPAAA